MDWSFEGRNIHAATGGQPFDPRLPAVVLIHGAGMDHTVWAAQARWLAHDGRSVLALDLPGHGGSDGPALTTIEAMAGWLRRFLDFLEVPTAALVGHSMGSLVALEAASHGTGRALALVGSVPRMQVHPTMLESARAGDHRVIDMMVGWSFGRQAMLGSVGTPGAWLPASADRLIERADHRVLASDLAACDAYPGALDAAECITCPTLLLLGAEDKMTPPGKAKALAEAIAGSRTEILKGVGHMMMSEAPQATTAALARLV